MDVSRHARMGEAGRIGRNKYHIMNTRNPFDELLDQNTDASTQGQRVLQTDGDLHLADGAVLCTEESMIGEANPKVKRGERREGWNEDMKSSWVGSNQLL